jgi:hypothetical protein
MKKNELDQNCHFPLLLRLLFLERPNPIGI